MQDAACDYAREAGYPGQANECCSVNVDNRDAPQARLNGMERGDMEQGASTILRSFRNGHSQVQQEGQALGGGRVRLVVPLDHWRTPPHSSSSASNITNRTRQEPDRSCGGFESYAFRLSTASFKRTLFKQFPNTLLSLHLSQCPNPSARATPSSTDTSRDSLTTSFQVQVQAAIPLVRSADSNSPVERHCCLSTR